MKYLHKFNENKDAPDSLIEIKNICNTNLAYLIDEGFKLDYLIRKKRISGKVYNTVRILLKKDFLFKWDDIKDDFLPNIIMLSEKYKLLTKWSSVANKKYICITFLAEKIFIDKYFNIEELETLILTNDILNIKLQVFL